MAFAACLVHRNTLTTPAGSPSQRYAAPAFKPADHRSNCRRRRRVVWQFVGDWPCQCSLVPLPIAPGSSPADAAYGEVTNAFGKPMTNTEFLPYYGDEFKLSILSKWNPSKERKFSGQVLRYEDNFDATSNVSVIITPTDKKSITDFGSPELFLSQVAFLLGKQAYFGKTDAEGGFESDAVATTNILETAAPVISEKPYYFISVLTRTADGDEGVKHQLINASFKDGKLLICKAQAGDKRWFKGAVRGNLWRVLQTRSALPR